MKTEDDSSDYVSAVPPAPAPESDPAARLGPSGAAADTDLDGHPVSTFTGPSTSPTRASQSKRT
ncbi:hypothetical protein Daus18300_009125, partial [Diaporthe australafricana]